MRNPGPHLPPGFRFHPTDQELIFHYLKNKVDSAPIPVPIIADVDIYKLDPWDLPDKAVYGEKSWYFFSPRDRKYPNGARPNRAAASGYWKATGTDKTIVASSGGGRGHVGVKKALVFYTGRPPRGVKTNWTMHEYRLVETNRAVKTRDSSMRLDDWVVLCRIYEKSKHGSSPVPEETVAAVADQDRDRDQEQEQVFNDYHRLPILTPSPGETSIVSQNSLSFSNSLDALDCNYSMLRSFLSENPSNLTVPDTAESYLFRELADFQSPSPEDRLHRRDLVAAGAPSSCSSKKCSTSCSFIHKLGSDTQIIPPFILPNPPPSFPPPFF